MNSIQTANTEALEGAAKYICTIKCGMCPMAVEQFPCPQACTLEVRPWQCWVVYFQRKQQTLSEKELQPVAGQEI